MHCFFFLFRELCLRLMNYQYFIHFFARCLFPVSVAVLVFVLLSYCDFNTYLSFQMAENMFPYVFHINTSHNGSSIANVINILLSVLLRTALFVNNIGSNSHFVHPFDKTRTARIVCFLIVNTDFRQQLWSET